MKILVPLKRVPDPDTRIRLRPDGSDIEHDGVKFGVNPFDAIAMEEAVKTREAGGRPVEIVAVTIGREESLEQLHTGLAMGADRAILVLADVVPDSLGVAKILAAIVRREKPDLTLMGKQAIDDDSNQAGQMLAALLSVPQATFVSKLDFDAAGNRARCARETDAGIEVVEISFPAVVTCDLRLNQPRYIALPSILKARRKPVDHVSLADLGVEAKPRLTTLGLETAPPRKAGIRVRSVDELLEQGRNEGWLTFRKPARLQTNGLSDRKES